MAKARKHGGSNHERFLGMAIVGYDYDHDLPDLIEEDVWSSISGGVAYDVHDNSLQEDRRPVPSWHRSHADRTGGLSIAFRESTANSPPRIVRQLRTVETQHHHQRPTRHAASAPVSVPNWPSTLRADSSDQLARSPAPLEADDEWMPPHEYLARTSGAVSGGTVGASMLEGVGRTLKGRDMSRVRDAVWRQTGFFG